MNAEFGTFFLRLITKSLGANYPIRLACGLGLAVLLNIAFGALAVNNPHSQVFIYLSKIDIVRLAMVTTPGLFVTLAFLKKGVPEQTAQQIDTVQALLDKAELSRIQNKMTWQSLLNKYIESISADFKSKPSLNDFYAELQRSDVAAPSLGESSDQNPERLT